MAELTKIVLSERDMPTHWYNISADLPAAGVELPPPYILVRSSPLALLTLRPSFLCR